MVTNCCRFLCYFCRISRQNQRSMFDHLSYLLQNSGIGLGQCQTPITLFSVFLFYEFICILNFFNMLRCKDQVLNCEEKFYLNFYLF